VKIGDILGDAPPGRVEPQFGPPTLEAVVLPATASDGVGLRAALNQLAEQDPLINVRYDDDRHELSVSLYGEIQKEVVQATLASDYGLHVRFGETTTLFVERPVRVGEALEVLQDDHNPTSATVGLRVEPAAPGTGVVFVLDVDGRTVPTYIYKSAENFTAAMTENVRRTLREGPRGWEVTDCRVTMTRCGYYVGDGPTKPTRPTTRTTAADFRHLTPLVLMRALEAAGTVVCGPTMRMRIECPAGAAGAVMATLGGLGGTVGAPEVDDETAVIEGGLPAGLVQAFRRDLIRITSGEGVVEVEFAGYRPVPRGGP
jgi:ribosomal protection tetracycline resistance protein